MTSFLPPQPPIEAYAVLAGGGVKGAALVGALAAAKQSNIKFVGYGGSSAGSIVALFASLGYSVDEMRHKFERLDFATMFDDGGRELAQLIDAFGNVGSLWRLGTALIKSSPSLWGIYRRMG